MQPPDPDSNRWTQELLPSARDRMELMFMWSRDGFFPCDMNRWGGWNLAALNKCEERR